MPNDAFRVSVLDQLLREVGIPFDGISVTDINANPVVASIQFRPEATQSRSHE